LWGSWGAGAHLAIESYLFQKKAWSKRFRSKEALAGGPQERQEGKTGKFQKGKADGKGFSLALGVSFISSLGCRTIHFLGGRKIARRSPGSPRFEDRDGHRTHLLLDYLIINHRYK